jgi:threonine dehydratase
MMDTVTKKQLDFEAAYERLKGVVKHTPLEYNAGLSEKYECEVYLKREDMQVVRSYKLRGAYNMISQLSEEQLSRGVVCASAGNHAQGVAYSCNTRCNFYARNNAKTKG